MQQYSNFDTASQQRSHEMNTYMDSQDFFALGSHLLTYIPPLSDYDTSVVTVLSAHSRPPMVKLLEL